MVSSDFRAISGNLAAMQRSVLEKKDRKQDGKRVRRSLRARMREWPAPAYVLPVCS